MPSLRDVVFRIKATDDTGEAVNSVESKIDGLGGKFGRFGSVATGAVAAVGAALAVVTAGIDRLAEAAERTNDLMNDLRTSLGGLDDDTKRFAGELIGQGFNEADVVSAVDSLSGLGGRLGLELDEGTAERLIGVEQGGGSATEALRAAQGFGIQGNEQVNRFLDIAGQQALSQGVGLGEQFSALRAYGPVFEQAGLGALESGEFVSDLLAEGIDPSRIAPGLNRAIRDASAEGVDPRAYIQEGFGLARSGDRAGFIDRFGAEGGLRLYDAISSGNVGFGSQLDYSRLQGELTLDELYQPSLNDIIEGERAQRSLEGGVVNTATNFIDSATEGGLGLLGSIPFVGEILEDTGSSLINAERRRSAASGRDSQPPTTIIINVPPNNPNALLNQDTLGQSVEDYEGRTTVLVNLEEEGRDR